LKSSEKAEEEEKHEEKGMTDLIGKGNGAEKRGGRAREKARELLIWFLVLFGR